jgi:hypothetical protein
LFLRRRASSHGDRRQGPFLHRLERASKDLNPILIVIIIGLTILNLSVFAALRLSRLQLRPVRIGQTAEPARPLAEIAILGLPQS